MPNPFKRPLNRDSLESWCKILDDIAKVAVLAIPVVLYGQNGIWYKAANGIFLGISAYFCLFSADFLRRNKAAFTEKE